MSLKNLEYFVAAYEHRSISEASQSLYISQQALSKYISNLEKTLSCELFVRTPKGIVPTKDGDYLYKEFAPLLREYNTTSQRVIDHFRQKPATLPFCCAPLIFRYLDPEPLLEFQEKYPSFLLQQRDMPDFDCEEYILADIKNFGIMSLPEAFFKSRYHHTMLKKFPLYLFVHRDHTLASRHHVSFADLKHEKFLVFDKKSYYRTTLNYFAKPYGYRPDIVFESTDIDQLCTLVNRGKGVMFCAKELLNEKLYENIIAVPFADDFVDWCIAFVCQDYEALDPIARKFIEFISEKVK